MKKFLASVGDAQLLGQNGEHIADVHTLTESSLSFSTTMEDVRAGTAAKLYGRFSHTTSMTCTLTDAMFDMNYIAYQVGDINEVAGQEYPGEIGGKIFNTESSALQISGTTRTVKLTKTAVQMGDANGLNKVMIWFKRPDSGNKSYQWHAEEMSATEISGKSFTIDTAKYPEFGPDASSVMAAGDAVCIRYFIHAGTAKTVKIKADFFPAEMVLMLTTKLYAGESANVETGKPIGHVTVKIPRFQLDGSFDLSMAMTSAASVSLSGSALAVADGTCDESGVYAEIVEYVEVDSEYEGIQSVVVLGPTGEINSSGQTVVKQGEQLEFYAIFEGGAGLMPDADITLGTDQTTADVVEKTSAGKIQVKAQGTTGTVTIKFTITDETAERSATLLVS